MLRTLLVPLDGSPLAEHVLPIAAALASRSGATLDVVRVHRTLAYGDLSDVERWELGARRSEREYVQLVADRVAAEFDVRTTTAVLDEPVAASICRRAAEIGADLVAMGTHGRTGFSRAWLGSIADAVSRQALRPVLLLRASPVIASLREGMRPAASWTSEPPAALRRILVALDGSGLAEQVVGPAIELARAAGASLCLVRVVQPVVVAAVDYPLFYALPLPVEDRDGLDAAVVSAREYLASVAARIRAVAPLEIEVEVVTAERVAAALADAAASRQADVVALATHGRGASRFVLGSVADELLRVGPAAVLLFRPIQD